MLFPEGNCLPFPGRGRRSQKPQAQGWWGSWLPGPDLQLPPGGATRTLLSGTWGPRRVGGACVYRGVLGRDAPACYCVPLAGHTLALGPWPRVPTT